LKCLKIPIKLGRTLFLPNRFTLLHQHQDRHEEEKSEQGEGEAHELVSNLVTEGTVKRGKAALERLRMDDYIGSD
jgi:hypothetical protein